MTTTLVVSTAWAQEASPPVVKASSVQVDDAAISKAVDDLITAADAVHAQGEEAYLKLRSLRRQMKPVADVIDVLRRATRKAEPAPGADATKANEQAEDFAAKAKSLFDMGAGTTKIVLARRDAFSSEVQKLEATPEDARADNHDAALERAQLHQLLMQRAYEAVWVDRAMKALEPYIGQGTFDGMFDEHLPEREHILAGFRVMFLSPEYELPLRANAAEGVAQFTRDDSRKEAIAECLALYNNSSEAQGIRDRALLVAARLGHRDEFDAIVKGNLDALEAESKKETPNPNLIIGMQRALANLYQGIHEYEACAKWWSRSSYVILSHGYDNIQAEARPSFGNDFYNFSCALSRAGHLDLALDMLEQSFNWGYADYDWAGQDGDLAKVRDHARYADMIKAWKSGEKTPGSVKLTVEDYLARAAHFFPKPKPEPQPDPKPQGQ
ncbi:MAG: hypothetical protein KDB53_17550, partial [Planctomycetes bacterium]|nr:hypothetical protein [Planctomycetota bacterium]